MKRSIMTLHDIRICHFFRSIWQKPKVYLKQSKTSKMEFFGK